MSASLLRIAARRTMFRAATRQPIAARVSVPAPAVSFSTGSIMRSSAHDEETFEEFTARYEKEFDTVQDVFELQRNLNNAFAYDLVPAPSVVIAALKAARRVDDYATAVRVFEAIKAKVENQSQYESYLTELKPIREELGIHLKEDLYPETN